jgi:dihydroneopterin aldolase
MTLSQRCCIGFSGHRVACIIGVRSDEREKPQEVLVDLEMEVEVGRCVQSDEAADLPVDYAAAAQLVTCIGEEGRFHLLESYAGALLDALFASYKIYWAKVTLYKPAALPSARYAKVVMERP